MGEIEDLIQEKLRQAEKDLAGLVRAEQDTAQDVSQLPAEEQELRFLSGPGDWRP